MGESTGRGTRKIIEINSEEKQDKKGIPPAREQTFSSQQQEGNTQNQAQGIDGV